MTASTWTIPLVLAALTLVGLVSALTGDGWRDWIAWFGLALPVAATGWAMRAVRNQKTARGTIR